MELSTQLIKLRNEAGLTQIEASKRSGINYKTINKWETEETGAGYNKLQQYLRIYKKELKICQKEKK